jgi:hypothetical protein
MERKIKLTAAIIMAICLMVILFQVPSKAQVRKSTDLQYHQRLQSERTFKRAMERNQFGTLKEAKQVYREKKKADRNAKKKRKEIAKRDMYLARIRELGEN